MTADKLPPCPLCGKDALSAPHGLWPLHKADLDCPLSSVALREEAWRALAAKDAEVERLRAGDEQRVRDLTKHITRADNAEAEVERCRIEERTYVKEYNAQLMEDFKEQVFRAEKAERERDEARERYRTVEENCASADKRADRLAAAIEKAPHPDSCASRERLNSYYADHPRPLCDCWKSKAKVPQ